MSKRHQINANDLESVIRRLQELVMANSGEDEFEEIFKILIAKLYCEKFPHEKPELNPHFSPAINYENINAILLKASKKWRSIFETPATIKLTKEHLAVCVEALFPLTISTTSLEVLDNAFEYLNSKTSKGDKGQYFTPRHVIECCIQMVSPSPNETILDPACGSGGFLIHALNFVKQKYKNVDIQQYVQNSLWGFDFDPRTIKIAKALSLISSNAQANLFQVNSLLRRTSQKSIFVSDQTPCLTIEDITRAQLKKFKGYDIIVTNPPFAGEIREESILENYELYQNGRRIERDVLFIERCVGLLRPGGKLCIVVPHNKLASNTWAYVREWLAKKIRIVSVLSLGRNTFLPHTHQKTSVIFGTKRETGSYLPNEDILFLISEKEGKDSTGQIINRSKISENLSLWQRADHDFEELVGEFKTFVTKFEIPWTTRYASKNNSKN